MGEILQFIRPYPNHSWCARSWPSASSTLRRRVNAIQTVYVKQRSACDRGSTARDSLATIVRKPGRMCHQETKSSRMARPGKSLARAENSEAAHRAFG